MNVPLDLYEIMPSEQRSYLSNYGWSFNKKACECAVKMMKRKNPATGKDESVEMKKKEEVEEILTKHGIKLEHNKGYNFVYVWHMGYSDYMGKSITDEKHLAMYVKDVIDDDDNKGGNVFMKWYFDCIAKGEPVYWEEIL